MYTYSFNKNANLDKLTTEINTASIPNLIFLNLVNNDLEINFSQELTSQQLESLTTIITNHNIIDTKLYIQSVIQNSINFGNKLISEFAAENVMMGITQDGMTGPVRKRMSEVVNALNTGSLYDAIAEAKAVPSEHKDVKYITDTRLLQFVNKIETYLGLPLSTSL